jgi:hypothetical protein
VDFPIAHFQTRKTILGDFDRVRTNRETFVELYSHEREKQEVAAMGASSFIVCWLWTVLLNTFQLKLLGTS